MSSKHRPPLSDSESDSYDSDTPPMQSDSADSESPHAAVDVKPISSKLMLQSPTSDSARRKKKKVWNEAEEGTEKKGKLLWSDEDEIVILHGMLDFTNKGKDPCAHLTQFFHSIKHSLLADVSKVQVHSKIRTFARKYHTALQKVNHPGEDPHFLKPHDALVFQLLKKLFSESNKQNEDGSMSKGDTVVEAVDVGAEKAEVDRKKPKRNKVVEASLSESKATTLLDNSPPVVTTKDFNNLSEYTYLNATLLSRDFSMMPIPPPGLGVIFNKRGWELMGCSNAARFDKRWKSVMIAETKAYLQRLDLVREQTQAMLDVLESADV